MISSQLNQYISGFDELIQEHDENFAQSGLKVNSVIRLGRLAVISGDLLLGAIGQISLNRLYDLRKRLATWLTANGSSL